MPCYSIQTMSVEMKAANKELLEKALNALGLRFTRNGELFTIHTEAGTIRIGAGETAELSGSNMSRLQERLNEIKRGYSAQVIQQVGRKNRWVNRYQNQQKTKGTFLRR